MPPQSQADDQPLMAPARYRGEHPVRISRQHGAVHACDEQGTRGKRRDGSLLHTDETILLPMTEVYGQTYLFDPHGERPPLFLGAGRCVLPEHAGLSDEALNAQGYEFQEGRSDFTPLMPLETLLAASPSSNATPAARSGRRAASNANAVIDGAPALVDGVTTPTAEEVN